MSATIVRDALDREILSALHLRGAVPRRRLERSAAASGSAGDLEQALQRLGDEGILKRSGGRLRLTPLGGKLAYALLRSDPAPLATLLDEVGEELPAGGRLLDLGCGPGNYLAEAATSETRLCVGLDIDAESLQLARSAASGGRGAAPLVRAEAESLPFRDGAFDRVLCVVVLPYVNETRVLKEAARVLRPGGRMIVTAHGAGYYLGLLLGPGIPIRRRIFGAISLAGTFTARAGLRLPGARFQSARWIGRALAPCGVRVARHAVKGRRFGMAESLRLVLERTA